MHYPPLRRLYRTRRLVIGAAQSMVRQTRRPGNRKGREKPLMPTQIADVGADALLEAKSTLDSDYIPREDEPFMNERQQEYFRGLLIAWKKTILTEAESTLAQLRSEENTSELQSLMRISYAVFCLKKNKKMTESKRT